VTSYEYETSLSKAYLQLCKWGDYVSKIYKKACDRLKILRMLKYQVDRNVLINIYLSFIRPILEYGNVIWDILRMFSLSHAFL
jgi:hypothetical protein